MRNGTSEKLSKKNSPFNEYSATHKLICTLFFSFDIVRISIFFYVSYKQLQVAAAASMLLMPFLRLQHRKRNLRDSLSDEKLKTFWIDSAFGHSSPQHPSAYFHCYSAFRYFY
jgi:hypothetical protein